MKNNQVSALLLVSMGILAGQLFLAMYAERLQYQDLMLVVPHEYGISSYDVKGIDKISGDSIAVTYEIKKRAAAEAVSSRRYPVTHIGTNSSYYQILGLQILEGSFFMEEARKIGNRYAVLSETAASRLFGSHNIIGNTVDLDGETFLVTGIVKDEIKKEAAVYVPSSTISAPVPVLMVKTKEGAETVRTSLQPLGVYETNSMVIDLDTVSKSFWQQFLVEVYLCFALLLILFAYCRVYIIRGYCVELKYRRKTMYLGELIEGSRQVLLRLAGHAAVLLAGLGIVLFLARQILEIVLGWKDILRQYKYLSDYFFQGKVQWLVRFFYCGPVLFLSFLVLLLMIIGLQCMEEIKGKRIN